MPVSRLAERLVGPHSKTVHRTHALSYSSVSSMAETVAPGWLRIMLGDQSPGPRLYKWTLDNLNPQKGFTSHSRPVVDAKRIYIMGIGNLGRLFAASLAALPDPPPMTLVVHREALLKHWADTPGVEMTRHGKPTRYLDFDVEMWSPDKPSTGPVQEVADGGKLSNLIVTTKAPDSLPQVDRVRRYLGRQSTVAIAANGISKLWPPHGPSYTASRFSADDSPTWLVCIVTHGVTSSGPFKSIHASPANVALGCVVFDQQEMPAASYLINTLVAAPYLAARHTSTPDLWLLQLQKLVVNSIINPLTAILRCKNGVLFDEHERDISAVMDLLLKEASDVLQSLVQDEAGKALLTNSLAPREAAQAVQAAVERFAFANLKSMLHQVGEKVRENTSSMLQDVRAGRTTEIREFNGWLVDTASYLDPTLDLTTHKTLMALVEQGLVLEKSQLRSHFPASD